MHPASAGFFYAQKQQQTGGGQLSSITATKSEILFHTAWRDSSHDTLCIRIDPPDGFTLADYDDIHLRINDSGWIQHENGLVYFTGLELNRRYIISGEYFESDAWRVIPQTITVNFAERREPNHQEPEPQLMVMRTAISVPQSRHIGGLAPSELRPVYGGVIEAVIS